MRLAYGEGVIIAILVPIVLMLIGIIKLYDTLFLSIALFGLWTIVAAFVLASERERMYYFGWGVVVAAISTAFVITLAYSAALVLIAIIALILYSASQRKKSAELHSLKS